MSQYGDDSYDDVDDIDADFVTLLVLRLTCSVSPSDFPPSSQRQGRRLCPPQKTQPAKRRLQNYMNNCDGKNPLKLPELFLSDQSQISLPDQPP